MSMEPGVAQTANVATAMKEEEKPVEIHLIGEETVPHMFLINCYPDQLVYAVNDGSEAATELRTQRLSSERAEAILSGPAALQHVRVSDYFNQPLIIDGLFNVRVHGKEAAQPVWDVTVPSEEPWHAEQRMATLQELSGLDPSLFLVLLKYKGRHEPVLFLNDHSSAAETFQTGMDDLSLHEVTETVFGGLKIVPPEMYIGRRVLIEEQWTVTIGHDEPGLGVDKNGNLVFFI